MIRLSAALAALALLVSCSGTTDGTATPAATADTTESLAASEVDQSEEPGVEPSATEGTSKFTAEVWADNWFALYVNGELVGEDSVSITTERSFNAETVTFEASYPLTVAIEAKDFKETDSGIEYIGQNNQQMGDGGLIAQITDTSTGKTIVSNASWSALVIHQAPLNTSCEKDPDPDATCEFAIIDAPDGWTDAAFDASDWGPATEWSADAVSPKDGYNEISWDDAASLIWGPDLEVDNTVLFRTVAE